MNKKNTLRTLLFAVALFWSLVFINNNSVYAAVLDEILDYTITVDVCEDATLDITYGVSWKVLDSDSEGPLEWVEIGLPNSHYNEVVGLTDTISRIEVETSGNPRCLIYFDRKYYKDEIVNFVYKVNIDNMYQMYPEEGVCEYTFTPGWFDNIAVDNMLLKWNAENVEKFEPSCLMDDGYNTWQMSLEPGEKFTVEISYPISAYAFDESKHYEDGSNNNTSKTPLESLLSVIAGIFISVIALAITVSPVIVSAFIVSRIFNAFRGFIKPSDKKITRTIIEYYDSCPNCGGTREEGKDNCSYCGSSMIKQKQEIKEENVAQADKGALKFNTNGDYKFSDNPNRYVRVNVVNIPHVVTRSSSSSGSSRSSHHSSCAHSSCACACACACAGGGRAGCSTKDFYNTDLKLKYFEKVKE